MADPAFLFYPGDYLRDTQCLSESVQVAYDRIMCEHMRNICISQAQLNFFTKRLNADQKSDLMMVLKKVDSGFYIEWVYASLIRRKAYSESRSKNRKKSYDGHMEIENIIEKENIIDNKNNKVVFKKPSVEEVSEYCIERKNSINPKNFVDWYESNGWKVGKNQMKNWKAAVRTWEARKNKPVDMLTETQKRNIVKFKNFEQCKEIEDEDGA